MHHYVNSSNEMLRKRGYRLTPQRFMILSVIQEAEEHLSIDQITERVQERNPYVSLSTIYRTLELLRELGLVRENHLPGEQPLRGCRRKSSPSPSLQKLSSNYSP